jgi:S1-C subfamily serine protease
VRIRLALAGMTVVGYRRAPNRAAARATTRAATRTDARRHHTDDRVVARVQVIELVALPRSTSRCSAAQAAAAGSSRTFRWNLDINRRRPTARAGSRREDGVEVGGAPNVFDGVLALLFAVALVRGWRQGAVLQIGGFAGLALGVLAGAWAAPRITGLVVTGPGPGAAFLTLGVLLVALVAGHALGAAGGLRLHRAVHRSGVGRLDRAAGVGVGGAGFLAVVWLLSSVLAQGPVPALAQQVRGSTVVRELDEALPAPPDVLGRIAALLEDQGFPQVFVGPGYGVTAPPVPAAAEQAVRAAAAAGQPSTVQVQAVGCGAVVGFGSGFVSQPGFVVTNAHVVAGFDRLSVRDAAGGHPAVAIYFDPALDVAVLSVPQLTARPIGWADTPAVRGTEGATLGFPGGQPEMVVQPATVQGRLDAIGRDIYGHGSTRREILALAVAVEQGDSGGPFVTSDGAVAGVVFAGDPGHAGTGYALTAEQVRPGIDHAIDVDQPADVGACRF